MKSTAPVIYFCLVTALACVQIFMGANIFVILSLYLISICGCFSLSIRDHRAGDILYFLFVLYYGTFSLVIKTALLQPVDENLDVPDLVSVVILVGFMSITVAYIVSRNIGFRFKFSREMSAYLSDGAILSKCVSIFFPIGIAFDTLHVFLRPVATQVAIDSGEGIGFFGTFYFITIFAVVCEASLAFSDRHGSRRGIARLGGMLLIIMLVSLAGNVKQSFIASISAAFVVFLMNKSKINIVREVVLGGALAFILMFYVSPAIHITRGQAKELPILERLDLAYEVMERASFDPFELQAQSEAVLAGYGASSDPRLNYFFPSTLNIDRLCLIHPTNLVVSGSETAGEMGLDALNVWSSVLPSFLVSKSAAASVDEIAWFYNFRARGMVARPVLGLVASSFAVGGGLGVLFLPGIAVLILFVILNGLSGPLFGNPFGLFIGTSFLIIVEADLSGVFIYIFRNLLFIVAFAVVVKVALDAMGIAKPPQAGAQSQ